MKSPEDFCPGDTGSRAGRLVGDPGAGPLETTRGGERYLPRIYSSKGAMTSPGVALHYAQTWLLGFLF